MKNRTYPTKLNIYKDIGNGVVPSTKLENNLLDSINAIKVNISIDKTDYPIEEINKSLNEVFELILGYFQQ
ncbi:hypothetical protein [Clostridium ganghwense]|uniref:Uncharacterized protein n=1 Tax=Clostridium ganghwense TaxID=312089 RepID=A0ABT4CTM8_9CLOT|nr:hypothetical protein [Clostridium ganghwense]MCY6372417.1 hypothetical protein [Clostridium ganghwense]